MGSDDRSSCKYCLSWILQNPQHWWWLSSEPVVVGHPSSSVYWSCLWSLIWWEEPSMRRYQYARGACFQHLQKYFIWKSKYCQTFIFSLGSRSETELVWSHDTHARVLPDQRPGPGSVADKQVRNYFVILVVRQRLGVEVVIDCFWM